MSWRDLQWFPEVGRLYGVNVQHGPAGVWFTKREAEVVDVLYKRRGRFVHKDSLTGMLSITDGCLGAHICNIRNKLAAKGSPWNIRSDYSEGYELRECTDPQANLTPKEKFAAAA